MLSNKSQKLICGSTFFLIYCPSREKLFFLRREKFEMIKTTFHRDTFMNKFYKLGVLNFSLISSCCGEKKMKAKGLFQIQQTNPCIQPKSSDSEFSLKSIGIWDDGGNEAGGRENLRTDNFNVIFSIGNCNVNTIPLGLGHYRSCFPKLSNFAKQFQPLNLYIMIPLLGSNNLRPIDLRGDWNFSILHDT